MAVRTRLRCLLTVPALLGLAYVAWVHEVRFPARAADAVVASSHSKKSLQCVIPRSGYCSEGRDDPCGSTGSEGDSEQARKTAHAAMSTITNERILRYLGILCRELYSPEGNNGIRSEMPGPGFSRPAAVSRGRCNAGAVTGLSGIISVLFKARAL